MSYNTSDLQDLRSSYDNFVRDKASIATDLTRTIANFEGIDYGSSNDDVTHNLDANLQAEQEKYNNISKTVEDVLNKTQEIKNSLIKAKEDLETVEKMYQELLADKPIPPVPKGLVEEDDQFYRNEQAAYQRALALWNEKKSQLESKKDDLNKEIELCEKQLSMLNTNGINSLEKITSINHSVIEVTPYVSLTASNLKAMNYREALYDECNNILKGKTSIENLSRMLNYTKEEVMESLAKNATDWYVYCDTIPSNIEDILKLHEKENNAWLVNWMDSRDDSWNKKRRNPSFNADNYNTYVSNVKIGNANFEFIQMFDKSKRNFVYDLNNYTVKANMINTISNYPENFFNTITKKNQKILLMDKVTDFYKRSAAGVAFLDSNRSYTLECINQDCSYNSIQILHHELSHTFDFYYDDTDKGYYTANHTKEMMSMFKEDYKKVCNLNGHGLIYADFDSEISNAQELFAESGALYFSYPVEISEWTDQMHNTYKKLFGKDVDEPRLIKDVGTGKSLLSADNQERVITNPERSKVKFTFGKSETKKTDSNSSDTSEKLKDPSEESKKTFTFSKQENNKTENDKSKDSSKEKNKFTFSKQENNTEKVDNKPSKTETKQSKDNNKKQEYETKEIQIKYKVRDPNGNTRVVTQTITVPDKSKPINNIEEDKKYNFGKAEIDNSKKTASNTSTNISNESSKLDSYNNKKVQGKVITEYNSQTGILTVYYPDGHVIKVNVMPSDYSKKMMGGGR